MMQTATADISNPVNGQIQNVRMLLDSGSQRTYITEALAKKLKLKRGVKTEIMVTTLVKCKSLQNWDNLWNEENLTDSFPSEKETTTIEILIGNDYYLDFILLQKVEVQPGLYMLASKLGWILTGGPQSRMKIHQSPIC